MYRHIAKIVKNDQLGSNLDQCYTVRILYNGERYNGIFDFRQKFRGDGFFPIKITTL